LETFFHILAQNEPPRNNPNLLANPATLPLLASHVVILIMTGPRLKRNTHVLSVFFHFFIFLLILFFLKKSDQTVSLHLLHPL